MILTCFLGIGNYQPCKQFHYARPEESCKTPYIQTALAQLAVQRGIDITEVRVLATDKAWQTHGLALSEDLQQRDLPAPTRYAIPDGSNETEFWTMFEQLRRALQGERVILDITHGFRAQPFFAAAVVQYMAALNELPAELEMHYGQLSNDKSECLIWDLSPFLALQQWSAALEGFLRHGKGHGLAALTEKLEIDIRRKLAKDRNQHLIKESRELVMALSDLSGAIATVRIPHIISRANYQNHGKRTPTAHAASVIKAIDNSRDSISNYMPALSPLLDQLRQTLVPLQTDKLEGKSSLLAQHALAGLYLTWQRPAEASIVLREASVSRHSRGEPLLEKSREDAEANWFRVDQYNNKSMGDLRNDIQHGGWRLSARRAESLHKELEAKHAAFDLNPATAQSTQQVNTPARSGRTIIITRHPGAVEWLHKQGYNNAERYNHLEQSTIGSLTSNDTVIGSLPIHLAAQVCATKAQFIFLQIEIPNAMRGNELSCAEMEQCSAQLAAFHVAARAET